MRILVLLSVAVLLAGLYFVVGWRHHNSGDTVVSAAATRAAGPHPVVETPGPLPAIEAVERRVEALENELTALRGTLERTPTTSTPSRRGPELPEEEFRRAYRDTIVKIIAEERQRQSPGNRAALLGGSVRRYLTSHRLEADPHADEWVRVLEDALARADDLKASAPSGSLGTGGDDARAAEWKSAWTALRADTCGKLATSLEARHVDVLLDMVFNF